MPKAKVIPWKRRVDIFLDYRRAGKKVYPTANKHNIARSTVRSVVEEFMKDGFADAPRPTLSSATLEAAQKLHLQKTVDELKTPLGIRLIEPAERVRGGLEPVENPLDMTPGPIAALDPIWMSETLEWHLRGTEAERVVLDGRQAINDYDERCLSLWEDISSGLEDSCSLPVYNFYKGDDMPDRPYVLHNLVDSLYHALWPALPPSELPDLQWQISRADTAVYMALAAMAAVGSTSEHDAVRKGTEKFLAVSWEGLQSRAGELSRLYTDLGYLKEVISSTFGEVAEEVVRRAICPVCPYPEARQGDPKT